MSEADHEHTFLTTAAEHARLFFDDPLKVTGKGAPEGLLVTAFILLLSSSNPDVIQGNETLSRTPAAPPIALSRMQIEAYQSLRTDFDAREKIERAERLVKSAMKKVLFDPDSARFSDLAPGRNEAVCGKVNAKNRYGAYVGYRDFVLSRDKQTVYLSENSDGVDSVLYGSFAEAYVSACANPQEKAQHAEATAPLDTTSDTPNSYVEPTDEPDRVLDAPPQKENNVPQTEPTT